MALTFYKFLQRLIENESTNQVNLISRRLIQVFEDHGVAASQIPRLLPQIQFCDLKSEDALLQVLNHEVLEQIAQLFCIRRQWLEGIDDQIYEQHSCYKDPMVFFEDLITFCHRKDNGLYFPVRAFTTRKNLDYNDPEKQLLALILVEKIATLDDQEIFRYHIFSDEWDWSYVPARIQVKAMIRLVSTISHVTVPLYVIKPDEMKALYNGAIIPHQLIGNRWTSDPSLEDYTIANSYIGKEQDELSEAIKYIEEHRLEGAITEELEECIKESEASSVHPERHQKNKRSSKRLKNQEDVWVPARNFAKKLWHEDTSLSIAEVVRQIKANSELKASGLGESGIRKRIVDLAPEGVRGKSGRKQK